MTPNHVAMRSTRTSGAILSRKLDEEECADMSLRPIQQAALLGEIKGVAVLPRQVRNIGAVSRRSVLGTHSVNWCKKTMQV